MAPKTILIVDDDQAMVQMIEDCFSGEGYQTLCAAHGGEALAVLATARPDLIVTDLQMPIVDGFALCRAVLADPATQTIPLVVITGFPHLVPLIDFPHVGFLAKPFDVDALLSVVTALIGPAAQQAGA